MTMPAQKPGKSEQSVGTPRVFLDAVEKRFGPITLDVAASPHNAVCDRYFALEHGQDGLELPWSAIDGLAFCNPPYGHIERWVRKALEECRAGRRSVVLIPASVGTNWWRHYVHNLADVYFLNGRITFVGHAGPFPKDCALLDYSGSPESFYAVWDWKRGVME